MYRMQLFADRYEAGQFLGRELMRLAGERPVVLGLPRGGVPVAKAVADALDAPLDVLVVRKLGLPAQPELGMGAIGEGGVRIVNEDLVAELGVSQGTIDAVTAKETVELRRRVALFRGGRPPMSVEGHTVILVDDGLATGFTARAAIEVLRRRGARQVVLAVPVGPSQSVEEMRSVADEVVCLETPDPFSSIGQWYGDFAQVGDSEVRKILAAASTSIDGTPA